MSSNAHPLPAIQPQLIAPATATNSTLPVPVISPIGSLPKSPTTFPSFSQVAANTLQAELDIEQKEDAVEQENINNIGSEQPPLPVQTFSSMADRRSEIAILPRGLALDDFEKAKHEQQKAQMRAPPIVKDDNGKERLDTRMGRKLLEMITGSSGMGMAKRDIDKWLDDVEKELECERLRTPEIRILLAHSPAWDALGMGKEDIANWVGSVENDKSEGNVPVPKPGTRRGEDGIKKYF